MGMQTERVEQFKDEIGRMRVTEPVARNEHRWMVLGIVLLIAGPAIGVYAYTLSHGTTLPTQQRDAIVLGLIGIAVTLVGVALFVRYSISRFLRFWLLRLSFENRAETDRVVAALGAQRSDIKTATNDDRLPSATAS